VPKQIPLLSTIHAFIATSLEYKKLYIKWLDILTYKIRPTTIIGVSKGAMHQYFDFLQLQPYKCYPLYTFADIKVFDTEKHKVEKTNTTFKIINVGALRPQKNQQLLLKAMHLLQHENVELDIYGTGPLEESLKLQLQQYPAKVNFKGEVKNMETILPQYDLFAMSSTFEGFSLAVLEAMAMKVPLLLTEITSFKEQAVNTAMYFTNNDPQSFVEQVNELLEDRYKLEILSETAYKRVIRYFTLTHHMKALQDIYTEALDSN
jgi:L-malate glycosyltransferase